MEENVYRISVGVVNMTSVDNACDPHLMGDANDRLRQARESAGFKSAAAAARKLRMASSTYASHENGQTPPPTEAVRRYARLFKKSAAWILTGEGPMDAQNLVALVGRIGAGGDIDPDYEQVPEGGIEEIELPISVGMDAVAFEVSGASMKPKYESGALIVCTKSTRNPESLLHVECAVRTSDNKRFLKIIRPGRHRGLFTLESFNSDPIVDVRLAWVGEILAVIPANRRVAMVMPRKAAG